MSWRSWFAAGFRRRGRRQSIELTEDGFRLCPGGLAVSWTAVSRVVTYKADLFAYDLICFGFTVDGCPATVVADEQMPGWDDLTAALPARLEGVADGWYGTVMHPAFATNARVIWTRPAGG